ncbi:uncharacterized protein BXZ73DRAFT_106151 [Epithele typhae]|uniref:uncharacterized protein n=1 Tax=Epithele typhae TaxID=378194 RepID=UPI002008CA07|nr:uncharacterized protein BXZ73DRAFT_106151 [Epithele typhae]KAH9915603.1 hypothetical protein BXZ73DRAFT_106151 [Epithele typhae]
MFSLFSLCHRFCGPAIPWTAPIETTQFVGRHSSPFPSYTEPVVAACPSLTRHPPHPARDTNAYLAVLRDTTVLPPFDFTSNMRSFSIVLAVAVLAAQVTAVVVDDLQVRSESTSIGPSSTTSLPPTTGTTIIDSSPGSTNPTTTAASVTSSTSITGSAGNHGTSTASSSTGSHNTSVTSSSSTTQSLRPSTGTTSKNPASTSGSSTQPMLSATAAPAAKAANAAMSAAVASAAVAFATAVHPNQDFALSAATSAARPSAATAAVCPSAAVAAFAVVAARSAAAVGPMHSAAASGAVVEHASAAVEADVLPSRSANSRQRMDRIVQNAQFLFGTVSSGFVVPPSAPLTLV